MWDKGVENTSGLTGGTFFGDLLGTFSEFSGEDWAIFFFKFAVFAMIFFIVPHLIKKFGRKNWNE